MQRKATAAQTLSPMIPRITSCFSDPGLPKHCFFFVNFGKLPLPHWNRFRAISLKLIAIATPSCKGEGQNEGQRLFAPVSQTVTSYDNFAVGGMKGAEKIRCYEVKFTLSKTLSKHFLFFALRFCTMTITKKDRGNILVIISPISNRIHGQLSRQLN